MTPRAFTAMLRALPGADASRMAAAILDQGFDGMVISDPFHEYQWDSLRALAPPGTITAVRMFLPSPRDVRPGAPSPFEASSLHPESRRDAVLQAERTILFADQSGIRTILVPPERIDDDLRKAALAMPRDASHKERLERLAARRAIEARPRLDSLLSFLSRTLVTAERYAVEIALLPGAFLDELPGADEVEACLREFRGAPLRAWIDTACRAAARAASPAAEASWERLGRAPAGATLRDVTPEGEPARLGEGAVDWARAKPLLEESPVWLADPAPGDLAGELAHARSFFERLSEGPREAQRLFPF